MGLDGVAGVLDGVERRYKNFNPEKIVCYEFTFNPNRDNWIDIDSYTVATEEGKVVAVFFRSEPEEPDLLEDCKYYQKGCVFLKSRSFLKTLSKDSLYQLMNLTEVCLEDPKKVAVAVNEHLIQLKKKDLGMLVG